MLNIAIVDDEMLFCELLKNRILELKLSYEYNIDMFDDPRDFLQNKTKYDLVFLDIDMPHIDGISLSKMLGEDKSLIIYVTSHFEKMEDAFGINVFRYLLKSKLDDKFASIFWEAIKQLNKNKVLTIKSSGEILRIRLREIVYAMYYLRDIYIYTKDEKEFIIKNKDLSEFMKQLNDSFLLINRTTVINREYIMSYDIPKLKMYHYEKISFQVTRKNKKAVFQATMKGVDKIA